MRVIDNTMFTGSRNPEGCCANTPEEEMKMKQAFAQVLIKFAPFKAAKPMLDFILLKHIPSRVSQATHFSSHSLSRSSRVRTASSEAKPTQV